jgi:hypothetical protein
MGVAFLLNDNGYTTVFLPLDKKASVPMTSMTSRSQQLSHQLSKSKGEEKVEVYCGLSTPSVPRINCP